MTIRIIEISDGYHDSSYFFENGRVLTQDNKEFINFLSKPHSEEYIIKTIHFDDIDADSEDFKILEKFEILIEQEQRKKEFEKIWQIYFNNYMED